MKVHEYQGKQIFRDAGIPVPDGAACFSVDEAVAAAERLGGEVWVVKAQIHAGGRGKGGGVKVAKSIGEVREHAEAILGMNLVTHQTGPEGQRVRRLLVEKGADIRSELYLGLVIDRSRQKVVLMGSSEGGMEIEEVAAKSPEKILKAWADPEGGFDADEARALAIGIGIAEEQAQQAVDMFGRLCGLFRAQDASLVEINPLVILGDGSIMALDAKVNFDDNTAFRHPEWADLRDEDEEDPDEKQASESGLSYISLDGDIGCMVNGAGLAMATMDIIKLFGGEPANFLDVGGGATTDQVKTAFRMMLKNERLKAILVNIFGGIMRCDVIAEGVVAAAREIDLGVPLVVRLEGTNVEQGKKILEESGLGIEFAGSMDEAAKKAVEAANRGTGN